MTATAPQPPGQISGTIPGHISGDVVGGSRGPRWAMLLPMLGIIAVVHLRLTSLSDSFPGWGGDPVEVPAPILGVTPGIAILLDVAMMLLSAVVFLFASSIGVRLAVALGLAATAVVYHASVKGGGGLDDAQLGIHWLAAGIAGVAAAKCSAESQGNFRILAAAMLCVVPVLALRGIVQVLVEHPETLASFKADKARYLMAQGWTPDSSMARAYERRISQAEAIGWFGLANVFATIMMAGMVCFIGLAAGLAQRWGNRMAAHDRRGSMQSGKRDSQVGVIASIGLMAALAAMGLVFAGAKGGFAAALVGVGALGAFFIIPWLLAYRGIGTVLGIGSVIGVLALIALRGAVGTKIGELSLLFRWYYFEAAGRIFLHAPWWGVGPDGFKDAYMLAKTPLSPEDVSSPHSIFLDYAATLGIGGIALGMVWMGWVIGAGKAISRIAAARVGVDAGRSGEDGTESLRVQIRSAIAPLVIGVLAGALLESIIATPVAIVIRFSGMAMGLAVVWAVLKVSAVGGRWLNVLIVSLAAAALALAAHAQMEMTAITPGAVEWIAVILGVASVGGIRTPADRKRQLMPMLTAAACLGVGAVAVAIPGQRAIRWELAMREAHAQVADVAEISTRLEGLSKAPNSKDDSLKLIAQDLSAMVRDQVRSDQVLTAFRYLRRVRMQAALESLLKAHGVWKNHFPTTRAASQLSLAIARDLLAAGEGKGQMQWASDMALGLAQEATATNPDSSVAWSWLANMCEATAKVGAADATMRRQRMIDAMIRAATLAPHEPAHAAKLAMLIETGDPQAAAMWAQRALREDENLRLDPLRQFSASEKTSLERIAAGGTATAK